MAAQVFALLKKYHRYLVRRAEVGDPISRHIDMSVQAAPWVVVGLVGIGICALVDAKFHLTPDQRGLLVLPFLAVLLIGATYVVSVITNYGVRKNLQAKGNSRSPWSP